MGESENNSSLDDGQVITLMRDAVRDVDRPTQHLVRAAVRRGHRRRRLTRMVEAASTLAVLATATVVIVSIVAGGHTTDQAATAKSPTVKSRAAQTQQTTTSSASSRRDEVALTPNVIITRAMKATSIDGTFTHFVDKTSQAAVGVAFTFHNGTDASEITISIRRNQPVVRCQQNVSTCHQIANGTVVTEKLIGTRGHPISVGVTSSRSDGTVVEVFETKVVAVRLANVPDGRTLWVDEPHLVQWASAPQWNAPVTQHEVAEAQTDNPIFGH